MDSSILRKTISRQPPCKAWYHTVWVLPGTTSNILCPKAQRLVIDVNHQVLQKHAQVSPPSHQALDKAAGNKHNSKDEMTKRKKKKKRNTKEAALHHGLLAVVKTTLRGINSKQNSSL